MKKELLIFFGILLGLALLFEGLHVYYFGFNEPLDIQLHDTYFVIAKIHLHFYLITFSAYLIYLLRAFWWRFKIKIINILLCISNSIFSTINMLLFMGINSVTYASNYQHGWTVYPPLSALSKEEFTQIQPGFGIIEYLWLIIFSMQLLSTMSLAYSAFQTGRNWQEQDRLG